MQDEAIFSCQDEGTEVVCMEVVIHIFNVFWLVKTISHLGYVRSKSYCVGATSPTVGLLVHQQDSFRVSVQGACDQIQCYRGGHICVYKNTPTSTLLSRFECLHSLAVSVLHAYVTGISLQKMAAPSPVCGTSTCRVMGWVTPK